MSRHYCFEEQFEHRCYDILAVYTGQYKPAISQLNSFILLIQLLTRPLW